MLRYEEEARMRGEGELRVSIDDRIGSRELPSVGALRDALVPRLRRCLHELGHAVPDLELPRDARPFPGSRFAWQVETEAGVRLTIRCELRPRRLWRTRLGSVRYTVTSA
ncbi:MAG: hypothetical protein JWQ48_2732 [Conexibacter sp.]|jgi:hypothetical protein|nr:hypothetical protein [Conexibacter sp.]